MIEIKNVSKRFGKKEVLKDVSCSMDRGIYGLLGPNGAGKTTLMRCMTNLYSLSGGEVLVDGVNVKKNRKVLFGYLPQSFGLFRELHVYDAMNYFCNLKGIPKKERREEIMRCIRAVNMEESLKTPCGRLSGGMMRRVGVAQALLNRPECILFDEPTAGLDPEERMRFKNTVSGLGTGETVLVSTHIVEDIEACCDKVMIMDRGKLLCVKTCRELKGEMEGRVIACKKGAESRLTGAYFIEKQFEREDGIYYRVLVGDRSIGGSYDVLDPTIEDGYMAVIKGI